jgi:rod shape-determining protein MreC
MFKRTSDRRRNIIILAFIFLISLALMTLNLKRSEKPFFFESVVLWVVSPVQNFFTSIVDSTTDIFDHYVFLGDVSRENEILREKNDALLAKNNALMEEIRRQKRISGLTSHQNKAQQKSIIADIVGRDATQWSKMIFINKGYKDGVTENLPVVTDRGVVGHIIQASSNVSKALLISDTRSAVDSLFQDSRVSGVVVGAGEGICKMKFVPIGASMKVGDPVLSSGLGGIYPKGLMVGTVVRQIKSNEGLFQEVTIKPSADLNRLEEVLVLLPE